MSCLADQVQGQCCHTCPTTGTCGKYGCRLMRETHSERQALAAALLRFGQACQEMGRLEGRSTDQQMKEAAERAEALRAETLSCADEVASAARRL